MKETSKTPVKIALDMTCGSWKAAILYELQGHTLRFSDLKKRVSGITQTMLTRQLTQLEHDGLVKREVYHQITVKVEYYLTPSREETRHILEVLYTRGDKHLNRKK